MNLWKEICELKKWYKIIRSQLDSLFAHLLNAY